MTIRDIAQRCRVSVATVSRVINESPSVSDKTREQVLRVMQDIGYIPNVFARGLSKNSMQMVGILCADVSRPYYAHVVSLLERSLRQKGFDSMLCCSGYVLEDKKKCLQFLLQKKVDAIILAGPTYNEQKDNSHIRAAAQQVPVFLINSSTDISNVYCVLCDEEDAMRKSVHDMAAAGYRDILYLHDMVTWGWAGSQKLRGVRRGLHECGIEENPALLCAVEHGIQTAQDKITQLLRDKIPFSGVLVSEDLLAIGVQKALHALGESRPIISFNNSIFTACATPTLTSVDNMLDTICPTAVDLLARLLNGEAIPKKIAISASLVERETFQRVNRT